MRPLNPLWYLGALILVLGSWMASAVIAAGAWDSIEQAQVSTGLTDVYAAEMSVAVYAVEPADDVTCTATDDDGTDHQVRPASTDIEVRQDGQSWTFVGLLYDAPEVVSIACSPAEGTYGVAVVDGFERGNIAIGTAIAGTLLGVGLAIWTYYARRAIRREEKGHD